MRRLPSDSLAGSIYRDKVMISVGGEVGRGTEPGGWRFHHATQNGVEFKTDQLFISGNFRLIFSDEDESRGTAESEMGPGGREKTVVHFPDEDTKIGKLWNLPTIAHWAS